MAHGWKGITSWKEYLRPVSILFCLGKLPCKWDFDSPFILASASTYFLSVRPWVDIIWCCRLSLRTDTSLFLWKQLSRKRSVMQLPQPCCLQPCSWSSEQHPGSSRIDTDQVVDVVSAMIYTTIFIRFLCCILLFQYWVGPSVLFCISLKAFVPAQ